MSTGLIEASPLRVSDAESVADSLDTAIRALEIAYQTGIHPFSSERLHGAITDLKILRVSTLCAARRSSRTLRPR